MAGPVKIDLAPGNTHYNGDTWAGLSTGPMTWDGGAMPSPLASARLHIRATKPKGQLAKAFTTADASISITDAATWSTSIPPQVLALGAGTYEWDMEFTAASGFRITLYYNDQFVITGDRTYD